MGAYFLSLLIPIFALSTLVGFHAEDGITSTPLPFGALLDMTRIGHQKTQFSGIILLIAALLILTVIFHMMSAAADKTMIYFYSSETNINNFKSLKMEFDRYLAKFGPYEFQPFSGRETFEKHVKGKENCLLVLSSWHYRHIQKEYSLSPALTGVRKGKKYQKRLLVAGEKSLSIDSVKTERIASASSTQHTGSVLKGMLKGKFAADMFRVLTVPKDIDALMSVGFGMSRLALTTRNSLEELKMVHPALCQKMKILLESDETLLLVLAVPEKFRGIDQKVVSIMKGMATDPDGKRKIRMLGVDGWQELNPSDMSKLES